MFSKSTRSPIATRSAQRGTVMIAARPRMESLKSVQTSDAAIWQQRAIATYHAARPRTLTAMQQALAARIAELTGRMLTPAAVYVNDATQVAVVTVDGVTFRLRHDTLMIVRPCVECGTNQFESTPIESLHDLGYALGTWQPRCTDCAPVDPINWLDQED